MELKIARSEISGKGKPVKLEKLIEEVKKEENKIFYFDKSNSHKDLMEAVQKFEEEGYAVYFNEIRYGLDDDDYMYQVHIL